MTHSARVDRPRHILAGVPARLEEEQFDTLLQTPGIRLQRVISPPAHTMGADEWFDQDEDEVRPRPAGPGCPDPGGAGAGNRAEPGRLSALTCRSQAPHRLDGCTDSDNLARPALANASTMGPALLRLT